MDTKITEIIPDNLPEWAIKAMAEWQLFNEIVRREQGNTVVVPVEKLLELRDAGLKGNLAEVHHILYGLADPEYRSEVPWAKWESMIGVKE